MFIFFTINTIAVSSEFCFYYHYNFFYYKVVCMKDEKGFLIYLSWLVFWPYSKILTIVLIVL